MRFFAFLVNFVGVAAIIAAAFAAAAAAANHNSSTGNVKVRMLKTKYSKAMVKSEKKKDKKGTKKSRKKDKADVRYEVWASDQSNSVPNQLSLGIKGGFMWIYDSIDIMKSLSLSSSSIDDTKPLPCIPGKATGPCNVLDVFPGNLEQIDGMNRKTGLQLDDLEGFGRLHGMVVDKFTNKYINANFFTPGGAYIGIIDTETKEAIALFRITSFKTPSLTNRRSVHMSFWSADGKYIFVDNLHGKAIERINIGRDNNGKIVSVVYDRSATIGLGKDTLVEEGATYFLGKNAYGNQLIGGVVGDYKMADLNDLTPNGYCKEDGCGISDKLPTGRTNNVPICPIPSIENNLYVTLGTGGLFVLDVTSTPMKIVGEYDQQTVNGAGLCGFQTGNQMFINAGISASSKGSDQSTFTVYSFNTEGFSNNGDSNALNKPDPIVFFKDSTNTNTIGNVGGIVGTNNDSGQLPGLTTRRDSHGGIVTQNGDFVHFADRIQNVVEVFNSESNDHSSYDLTTETGTGTGADGACSSKSVVDDPDLPKNDPSPDLADITPDGTYMMIGLRGPSPVTVAHSAQGSCPGVGIVKITDGGRSGKLIHVIRTTNKIDTAPLPLIVGGIQYTGTERSDIHMASVVIKNER